MTNNFYTKYLKYKKKYVNFKNQHGGSESRIHEDSYQIINQILVFIAWINAKLDASPSAIDEKTQHIVGQNITLTVNCISITYTIIKFLGTGAYGSVFKIMLDCKFYVIKLGKKNLSNALDEATVLEELMKDAKSRCNYKAISYGEQNIGGMRVYHIIFPFRGNIDLYEIFKQVELAKQAEQAELAKKGEQAEKGVLVEKEERKLLKFIPKYIKEIIQCLIKINKQGVYGDLHP